MTTSNPRAAFDTDGPMTVGIEEELMLLDPETHDLRPVCHELVDRLSAEARFKRELPASQVEIVSPPCESAAAAARFLTTARADLQRVAGGRALLAATGVHPFAAPEGELSSGPRYDRLREVYGRVAQRQLVFGLQVHVAVRGSDRTLAVYNALRSYLPELLALAANAPFYAGEDTGLATVRPKISELLPRQGVPPAIESWESFATELEWGARAGGVPDSRFWWWELRPHPTWGTLELRVPDAQSSVADAEAVVDLTHALVRLLVARFDAGESLPAAPTWRIEENRWQALSRGGQGMLADLDSGATAPARERLHAIVDLAGPDDPGNVRRLIDSPGWARQREAHAEGGMRGLTEWLISRYSVSECEQ